MAEVPAVDPSFSKMEMAAILMLAIGEKAAAKVMRHLTPKEVQTLGSQMTRMQDVNSEGISEVVEGFLVEAYTASGLGVGADSYIRNVLIEALGEERASSIIDHILMGDKTKGLEAMRWMNPKLVSETIKGEHPQIQAVLISYLYPDQAAEVMSYMSEKARTDVMMRIASLDSVNQVALQHLNQVLEEQVGGVGVPQNVYLGGVKFAADIMNNMESQVETTLMDNIKEVDEDMGTRIQDLMFVFEDLKNIDDSGIQSLLREISSEVLVIALKGADEEMKQKIFGNMSKRAAELLRDDLEVKGPVRVSEVEAAQREILAAARRMADAGEIQLGGGGEMMI